MRSTRTSPIPAALTGLSGAIALCCSFSSLAAQDSAPESSGLAESPLVEKLEDCTTIADDAQRLACFDREVAALVAATGAGALRVVEEQDITEARKKLFGYQVPDAGIFATRNEEEREAAQTLVSTITRVRKVGSKEYHIWIEEGDAVWRMKGTSIRFRAPEVGDPVEFKPATMGTYWIRVDGRKGVRGNRIG
jgi:hypothetical protein